MCIQDVRIAKNTRYDWGLLTASGNAQKLVKANPGRLSLTVSHPGVDTVTIDSFIPGFTVIGIKVTISGTETIIPLCVLSPGQPSVTLRLADLGLVLTEDIYAIEIRPSDTNTVYYIDVWGMIDPEEAILSPTTV